MAHFNKLSNVQLGRRSSGGGHVDCLVSFCLKMGLKMRGGALRDGLWSANTCGGAFPYELFHEKPYFKPLGLSLLCVSCNTVVVVVSTLLQDVDGRAGASYRCVATTTKTLRSNAPVKRPTDSDPHTTSRLGEQTPLILCCCNFCCPNTCSQCPMGNSICALYHHPLVRPSPQLFLPFHLLPLSNDNSTSSG